MQRSFRTVIISISFLLQAELSFSQIDSGDSALFAQIDSIMAGAIRNSAFPGGVLLAMHEDSVVLEKAYGYHTYDSLRAVKTSDIYDLASVTKVTAATLALMGLYEDGLLDLDQTVHHYMPEMKGKRGNVTIREILAHQSGWRSWIPFHVEIRDKKGELKKKYVSSTPSEKYDWKLADGKYLRNDFYNTIKKYISKAEFNPEQGYVYSGMFFYLVPEIVQKQTGMAFEEYLRTRFYDPLGAQTTVFNPLKTFSLDQIVPTEVDTFFRQIPIHGWVHDEGAIMMRGVSGNAGLFSNAEDLARVWLMLQNRGVYQDSIILKEQTVDLFTVTHYPNNENRRGLGFDKPLLEYDSIRSGVAQAASTRSFGHTGYTGPIVWADPEKDLLFIFMCNRVYPTRNNRALYDMRVRQQIHERLYGIIDEF